MTTQQQLDQQFEDLKNLALVCFINDLGATAFVGLSEREMTPLFHGAGLKTPDNLLDGPRIERVMARLHQISARQREDVLAWLKRSAN